VTNKSQHLGGCASRQVCRSVRGRAISVLAPGRTPTVGQQIILLQISQEIRRDMMRILFTRHGESEANIQRIISNRGLPHHLTTVGVSQSMAIAESLVSWDVRKVISSRILRAKETGNILAEKLGVPFVISNALREFDCGIMDGRGDDDAWIAHNAAIQAWDESQDYSFRILPDGESFDDVKARFLPFITKLIETDGNVVGDILLVSHGSMLSLMLPLVLVNIDRTFTKQHPLGNCKLVVTQPQSARLVCTDWAGISLSG
jgi:broad specificity phosphatase PhoE